MPHYCIWQATLTFSVLKQPSLIFLSLWVSWDQLTGAELSCLTWGQAASPAGLGSSISFAPCLFIRGCGFVGSTHLGRCRSTRMTSRTDGGFLPHRWDPGTHSSLCSRHWPRRLTCPHLMSEDRERTLRPWWSHGKFVSAVRGEKWGQIIYLPSICNQIHLNMLMFWRRHRSISFFSIWSIGCLHRGCDCILPYDLIRWQRQDDGSMPLTPVPTKPHLLDIDWTDSKGVFRNRMNNINL